MSLDFAQFSLPVMEMHSAEQHDSENNYKGTRQGHMCNNVFPGTIPPPQFSAKCWFNTTNQMGNICIFDSPVQIATFIVDTASNGNEKSNNYYQFQYCEFWKCTITEILDIYISADSYFCVKHQMLI